MTEQVSVAEFSVIGACLIDKTAYDRVAHIVHQADFQSRANRLIWQAIESVAAAGQEEIDVVSVADELERQGKIEAVGGLPYLVGLANDTPSAENVEAYANMLRRRATPKHLSALCRDIADKCRQPDADPDALILEAETRIHRLAAEKHAVSDLSPVRDALTAAVEHIDAQISGQERNIPSGIGVLDELTGGFMRGSMHIVAARPSQGKTALGLTLIVNAARKAFRCGLFSIEMPKWQIGLRLTSIESGIPATRLSAGELADHEWTAVTEATKRVAVLPIMLSDASEITIPTLRAMVSREQRMNGLDMIVVDYLQLMKPPKLESRERQVAALSAGLKAIAKEFGIAVICLAQLNRDATGRRPRMSDIRESGAAEQDADMIILIHRERDESGEQKREAELIVDKNRNGQTGICRVVWEPEIMRFCDYVPDEYLDDAEAF